MNSPTARTAVAPSTKSSSKKGSSTPRRKSTPINKVCKCPNAYFDNSQSTSKRKDDSAEKGTSSKKKLKHHKGHAEQNEEQELAYSLLSHAPGGHLSTKASSADTSKENSVYTTFTNKYIRLALNVLYFKLPLNDWETEDDVKKIICKILEQYPILSDEELHEAFKVNGHSFRLHIRVKRRMVLSSFIQDNLYASVSEDVSILSVHCTQYSSVFRHLL